MKKVKNLLRITVALLLLTSVIAVNAQKGEGNNTSDQGTGENSTCSGCKLSFTADEEANVEETPPSAVLGEVEIEKYPLGPCLQNIHGNYINFELTVYAENVKDKCAEDCGPSKCKADLTFELKVGTDFYDDCVLKQAKPTFKFRYNNKYKTIGPEELLEAYKNNEGVIPFDPVPFEQSCGQSTELNISGDITYTTERIVRDSTGAVLQTFEEPAVLVYDMNSLGITCEACEEQGSSSDSDKKLKQTEETTSLNVYPNPANNRIHFVFDRIATETEASLRISNLMGQVVYTKELFLKTGENQLLVDTQDLSNGTYFYTYTISGKVEQGRIIVQHNY